MSCNCDENAHERLDIHQDKSDQYETVYNWICQNCGHTWEES